MTKTGLTSITIFLALIPVLILCNQFTYSFSYSADTSASKEQIWQLWTDVENWKQFDERLEYSYLEAGQQFGEGASGYLKGKNAPRTGFNIESVQSNQSFSVRLQLPLGQSIEMQRFFRTADNFGTRFTHRVEFHGWLKPISYLLLSAPFKSDLHLVVDSIQALADEDSPTP